MLNIEDYLLMLPGSEMDINTTNDKWIQTVSSFAYSHYCYKNEIGQRVHSIFHGQEQLGTLEIM